MLIGFGALVLGSSGFIASGAFDIGSQGSEGSNWVQVDASDIQEATEERAVDVEEEEEETGEVRVQIVTDPQSPGNRVINLGWGGEIAHSEYVVSDDDGFVEALDFTNLNTRALTRVGTVTSNGYAGDTCAFLIANVGGVGQPGVRGRTVDVLLNFYPRDTNDPAAAIGRTDQINLPYFVNRSKRGRDLLGEPVELRPNEIIQVVIEIDARNGTSDLDRMNNLGISVR